MAVSVLVLEVAREIPRAVKIPLEELRCRVEHTLIREQALNTIHRRHQHLQVGLTEQSWA